jgi:hypothetical protein
MDISTADFNRRDALVLRHHQGIGPALTLTELAEMNVLNERVRAQREAHMPADLIDAAQLQTLGMHLGRERLPKKP